MGYFMYFGKPVSGYLLDLNINCFAVDLSVCLCLSECWTWEQNEKRSDVA